MVLQSYCCSSWEISEYSVAALDVFLWSSKRGATEFTERVEAKHYLDNGIFSFHDLNETSSFISHFKCVFHVTNSDQDRIILHFHYVLRKRKKFKVDQDLHRILFLKEQSIPRYLTSRDLAIQGCNDYPVHCCTKDRPLGCFPLANKFVGWYFQKQKILLF